MKRLVFVIGVSLLSSLLCLGCNGGGSDGGGSSGLEGTWLGWIEDDDGNVDEFSLEIDGDDIVTAYEINGASTGDTGHINEGWDENVFHVLYNGGPLSHGIMIVDDEGSHATYGDYASGYYLGVLEKGATDFPSYEESDIVASYPVGGVYTGDAGLWEGDDISMTVAADLTFSGSDPDGAFSGGFDDLLFDSDHGRYEGSLTSTAMTMEIIAFVSPDGTAVAAFAWEESTVPDDLEDFTLIGFKR
jgi:hypothetical protein